MKLCIGYNFFKKFAKQRTKEEVYAREKICSHKVLYNSKIFNYYLKKAELENTDMHDFVNQLIKQINDSNEDEYFERTKIIDTNDDEEELYLVTQNQDYKSIIIGSDEYDSQKIAKFKINIFDESNIDDDRYDNYIKNLKVPTRINIMQNSDANDYLYLFKFWFNNAKKIIFGGRYSIQNFDEIKKFYFVNNNCTIIQNSIEVEIYYCSIRTKNSKGIINAYNFLHTNNFQFKIFDFQRPRDMHARFIEINYIDGTKKWIKFNDPDIRFCSEKNTSRGIIQEVESNTDIEIIDKYIDILKLPSSISLTCHS